MTWDGTLLNSRGALGWVGALASAVPPERLDGPTPCEGWTVRTLLGHLIGTAERSLRTAVGLESDSVPHVVTTVADRELAARHADLGLQVGRAWADRTWGQQVRAPWGACTSQDAVVGFTIETLVHGWDLAVATAQPSEAPDDLAEAVAGAVDVVIAPGPRARRYDRPQPSVPGAGPTERLATLLGRRVPTHGGASPDIHRSSLVGTHSLAHSRGTGTDGPEADGCEAEYEDGRPCSRSPRR